MKAQCADCGRTIGAGEEPWELEDGRTVCQACAAEDLRGLAERAVKIARPAWRGPTLLSDLIWAACMLGGGGIWAAVGVLDAAGYWLWALLASTVALCILRGRMIRSMCHERDECLTYIEKSYESCREEIRRLRRDQADRN